MVHAVKSVLNAEDISIRDLIADAVGVISISVVMTVVLWLPALLSA